MAIFLRPRRVIVALAIAGFIWSAASVPAQAHGIVQRTEPEANTSAGAAPRQVVLSFSEPADAALSSGVVTDRSDQAVSTASGLSADGRRMTITLPPIPNGIYTVRWRALWPADGHSTSGYFLFAVGESAPTGSSGRAGPPPLQVAFRWVAFLGALVVAGVALFRAAILPPALRTMDPAATASLEAIAEIAESRLRLLIIISGAAVAIASAGEFLLLVAQLLGASVVQAAAGGLFLPLLWSTRAGWSLLLRLSTVFLLLLPSSPAGRILQIGGLVWLVVVGGITALFRGPGAVGGSTHIVLIALAASVYGMFSIVMARILPQIPDIRAAVPQDRWVKPLAGAVLLAAFTMTAHAAGGGLGAAAVDWAHLLGAAAWVGGLAALRLVLVHPALPARERFAGSIVSRFSLVAGSALGVLVVTGVLSTLRFVPSVRAFVITPYGRLLLAKLALVVPMAVLGGVNFFVLRPRLVRQTKLHPALHRLLASVTGEGSVGVLIVLIVAALTITPTARVALQAPPPEPAPLALAGAAGDVRVTLTIAPARPGSNRFTVRGTDQQGTALDGAVRVLLRATKLDEDLDPVTLRLTYDGEGAHTIEDAALGLAGWWQVEVVIRRRGQLDVATQFPLWFEGGPARPDDAAARRALLRMEETMARLSTWRQVEQLTDGRGNFVVTRYDLRRPDRLRYRTSSGNEGVIVGPVRYFRSDGGAWKRDVLARPFAVEDYILAYTRGARALGLGRTMPCGDGTCRVVTWETGGGPAVVAGWIDEGTSRLRRIMMIGRTEAHYMTLDLLAFDIPLQIELPR